MENQAGCLHRIHCFSSQSCWFQEAGFLFKMVQKKGKINARLSPDCECCGNMGTERPQHFQSLIVCFILQQQIKEFKQFLTSLLNFVYKLL